jgi:hypothetical protein
MHLALQAETPKQDEAHDLRSPWKVEVYFTNAVRS